MWQSAYPRTVPEKRPPGHTPRAPRWTAAFDAPISLMTCDYLAIQCGSETSPEAAEFLATIRATHTDAGNHRPEAWELLSFTDDEGMVNLVHLGYWRDATQHARWAEHSRLATWFASLDPSSISFGAWHEVVQTPLDRLETIYSDPRREFGLAACPGISVSPMTTNGYYGAARDRMPASAIDRLEAGSPHRRRTPAVPSLQRRLRAESGHNTAVIRSGQFYAGAEGEQLRDYRESLEPKLMAGMEHLKRKADTEGTMSLRIMTSRDTTTLQPQRETSVYGHFHTLESLERWAAEHSTHAAIYEHAIRKNREYGADRAVTTWHEVFVLPRCASYEYVNCHPRTGILPFARTVMDVH
ncbi:phenylacetaldoxime dehydratase family protein [Streptomyces sp. NPDC055078]